MNLYEKIISIYPELAVNSSSIDMTNPIVNGSIIIQNDMDGNGEYIAKWDYVDLQKPTSQQLV